MTPEYHKIEKFTGVDKKTTETLIPLGGAADMSNWIITDDMKLQKMYGYAHLFSSLGAHKINGIWYGTLNGVNHLIFACNGHVYECNMSTYANTDLGTVTDAFPTAFWATNNTVYIMDGTEFYSWTGTGIIATVTGYAPTILTATPPAGGGTILEPINYLIGKKTQKFSANGTSYLFQLAEYNITSVDAVYLNGVLKTVTTDYTVSLTNGTVTFVALPAEGVNNVSITWTKTTSGDRQLITNCKYYGGSYYSRFWLYGNSNHKNTRYVSGITMAGVSDPSYWPKYADSDVGEYEITDITVQGSNQIIFTSGAAEASAWFSYPSVSTDSSTGIVTTTFPVEPLNKKVGNVAKGQSQIIVNNPFTVWKGVYEWVGTNIENEKNAQIVSDKVQTDLDAVDLTTALTVDWSDKGLYWLCVGKKVWVYNYRVKAWYILELSHTPTCFSIVDSDLYFGTTDGYIMAFDEALGTYDGAIFSATWDSGYYTFGAEFIEKYIRYMQISILPLVTTHVRIYVSTDKNAAFRELNQVSYSLSNFATWDFSTFSFATNYSPQPFRRDVNIKNMGYTKIRLVNDGTDGAVVLSITLPIYKGGESNRR